MSGAAALDSAGVTGKFNTQPLLSLLRASDEQVADPAHSRHIPGTSPAHPRDTAALNLDLDPSLWPSLAPSLWILPSGPGLTPDP